MKVPFVSFVPLEKELNIELKDNVKFIINHYSEIDKSELKINIIEMIQL